MKRGSRAEVEARHIEMVRLRSAGRLLKHIEKQVGRHRATIIHHLRHQCRCSANGYEPGPRVSYARRRVLECLRQYGPIRSHALSKILREPQATVGNQLGALQRMGLVERQGWHWWAL